MTPKGSHLGTWSEERDFDTFLDALTSGREPPDATASALAATAQRIHTLAATDRSTPPATTLAAIREDIMDSHRLHAAAASTPVIHANGVPPSASIPHTRLPRTSTVTAMRRPRWLVANASLAAVVLLTIGIGLIAFRVGPGAPSEDDPEGPAAGIMVSSPATAPLDLQDEGAGEACETNPGSTNGCLLFAPIAPAPASCQVKPRSVEEVAFLSEVIEQSRELADIAITTPISIRGTRPSPATIDAISTTVREVFVCLRSGNDLGAYALFTDDVLQRIAARTTQFPAETLRGYGPREPQQIIHAGELPDGSVVATISFRVYGGFIEETWRFVPRDGRYLVDAVDLTDATPTTPDGQPGMPDCSVDPETKPGCNRSATVVPDPSECVVEPRTVEEVAALFSSGITAQVVGSGTPADATIAPRGLPGTPIVFTSTPVALSPELTELPDGPAPDEQTVAAVTATWRQYIACANAGDYFRLTALFSDTGFQRTFVQNALPPSGEELALIQRRGAFSGQDPLPYMPLSELRLLPDGRVGAMIEVNSPSGFQLEGGNRVVFANVDGRWLIDELALGVDAPPVEDVQRPPFVMSADTPVRPIEDGVNLRSVPGYDAEPITTLDRSDTLTIAGAPVEDDGQIWVPVVTSDGVRGWILGDFIELVTD